MIKFPENEFKKWLCMSFQYDDFSPSWAGMYNILFSPFVLWVFYWWFSFYFSFSFFIWSVQFSVKWFIDSFWVIHRPCQELFPLSSRVVVLWYPVCFLYNVVSRKVLQVNGCSVNIIIIIQSHGIRQEISNNSLTSKRNTITSSGAVTMESLNL